MLGNGNESFFSNNYAFTPMFNVSFIMTIRKCEDKVKKRRVHCHWVINHLMYGAGMRSFGSDSYSSNSFDAMTNFIA